jgi:hypothetical protein
VTNRTSQCRSDIGWCHHHCLSQFPLSQLGGEFSKVAQQQIFYRHSLEFTACLRILQPNTMAEDRFDGLFLSVAQQSQVSKYLTFPA